MPAARPQTATCTPPRPADLVLLGLVVPLSGAAGLVHEVAWMRLLRLAFGNTQEATATVLAVFMAGLGLGSHLVGRRVGRSSSPLRWFAALEAATALLAIAVPLGAQAAFPLLDRFYDPAAPASFGAARLIVSCVLLLPAATAMGGTLPALAEYWSRRRGGEAAASGGLVYGANTFGAVAGCLAAAFVLVPHLGTRATIAAAAGANALAAVAAWRLAGPAARGKSRASKGAGGAAPAAGLWSAAVLYALVGGVAMVLEVAWTRTLSLLAGSSVYAFSVMLAAFLLGIAGGSFAATPAATRSRAPRDALAGICAAIALWTFVTVVWFENAPIRATVALAGGDGSFARLVAFLARTSAFALLPATLLFGAAFPFAVKVIAEGGVPTGRAVALAYAANTIGAVGGALAGGLLAVRFVGVRGSLLLAGGLLWLAAVGWAAGGGLSRPRRRLFAAAALALAVGLPAAAPRWEPGVAALGPFVRARRLPREVARDPAALERMARTGEIVFYEEGPVTTVAVRRLPDGEKILSVNGKPDASTRRDLPTQLLLGHVPAALAERPRRALVVGLASGITLAAVGRHPFERLVCAEISPAVVRACRVFAEENDAILDDPRVSVLTVDGRTHLVYAEERYDVVVSEPSNPWIAGIGDLFTLEFFQAARDRLSDGGALCVWLETYNLDRLSFRAICRTFLEVFPNATLWKSSTYDCQLVGWRGEVRIGWPVLRERLMRPEVRSDLERIGIDSPERFAAHQALGPKGLARFCGDAPLHRDDDALVEFRAPRVLLKNADELRLLEEIEEAAAPEYGWLEAPADVAARLARAHEQASLRRRAEIEAERARRARLAGDFEEALRHLRRARGLFPDLPEVASFLAEGIEEASRVAEAGAYEQAVGILRTVLRVAPDEREARRRLADVLKRWADELARAGAEGRARALREEAESLEAAGR